MSEAHMFEKRSGRWAMVVRHKPDRFEWITVDVKRDFCRGEMTVQLSLAAEQDSHLLTTGVKEDAKFRIHMDHWLAASGYCIAIPTNFSNEENRSASELLAERFRQQCLRGDFTPFDNMVYIRWFSQDCFNTLALGDHYSRWLAESFLPELLRQLLAGCTNDQERRIILDDHFCLGRSRAHWRKCHSEPVIVEARALVAADDWLVA